jgi:uncharacterized membrane protein
MTKTEQAPSDTPTPLDALRTELANYAVAKAKKVISSAAESIPGFGSGSSGKGSGEGSGEGSGKESGKGGGLGRFLSGGGVSPKNLAGGVVKGTAEKAGGAVKGAAGKTAGSVKDAMGGGGGGGGDQKATVVIETADVPLPRRDVYDYWTDFESFPSFTKGVTDVSYGDDETESDWKVKIAFSNRQYKASIQEQIPDERIVWDSEGNQGTTHGAVSFHELTPDLTRVVLVVEYRPVGFMEKTGNLWRAQGRRLRLDLKHFQRYATLTDEAPDGWRGEIQDGEIVRTHEQVLEDEDEDEDEGEDEDRNENDGPDDDADDADDADDVDDGEKG